MPQVSQPPPQPPPPPRPQPASARRERLSHPREYASQRGCHGPATAPTPKARVISRRTQATAAPGIPRTPTARVSPCRRLGNDRAVTQGVSGRWQAAGRQRLRRALLSLEEAGRGKISSRPSEGVPREILPRTSPIQDFDLDFELGNSPS